MKKLVLIVLLFCVPFVYAQVDNYNNYSSLTADVLISSTVQNSGAVKDFTAALGFFPKDYDSQRVISSTSYSAPQADVTESESAITFHWSKNYPSYSYSSLRRVEKTNTLVEVTDTPTFPVPVPSDLAAYTLPQGKIDITPEIGALAENIVGGETDAYKAVFLLANWTQKNIAYNLSTLNVNAVESSSWVLEHREGVCDELTNLFISLARSQGIPARFVSGVVYSNVNHEFGAHGWAEVYIDNHWIPVDPTFGTFGWVDPSHIKFKEELGSNQASVQYEWLGADPQIQTGGIIVNTSVVSGDPDAKDYVDMKIESLRTNVGSGSYVPLQLDLRNPYDFYVPVQVYLSKAPEVVGENSKSILLEPHSEGSLFWIVRVPLDVQEGYLYTTKIAVNDMYGGVAETNFTFSNVYDVVSQQEAEALLAPLMNEVTKPYLTDVSLQCATDKEFYYPDEQGLVDCSLQGNLNNIQVCFGDSCAAGSEKVYFPLDVKQYTSQRLAVRAEKDGKARHAYFDLRILSPPNVTVQHVKPKSIGFHEEGVLEFDLLSESPVQNLSLKIDGIGSYSISSFSGEKNIQIAITGKDLALQDIPFTFDYQDQLSKEYHTEQLVHIDVPDVPWWYKMYAKILSWFAL
ncbi:transglutaminase domain-containing protein [Candidatus Woesearchaeota archaeon]|nr:transglutaminase domain-containing protein [Candidatus Woesearchaeota archaeon]